jgi:hypothetical protein
VIARRQGAPVTGNGIAPLLGVILQVDQGVDVGRSAGALAATVDLVVPVDGHHPGLGKAGLVPLHHLVGRGLEDVHGEGGGKVAAHRHPAQLVAVLGAGSVVARRGPEQRRLQPVGPLEAAAGDGTLNALENLAPISSVRLGRAAPQDEQCQDETAKPRPHGSLLFLPSAVGMGHPTVGPRATILGNANGLRGSAYQGVPGHQNGLSVNQKALGLRPKA